MTKQELAMLEVGDTVRITQKGTNAGLVCNICEIIDTELGRNGQVKIKPVNDDDTIQDSYGNAYFDRWFTYRQLTLDV